ncbi:hypothetical protein Clacol_003266 [Clathrus columnatus]|uniref:Uncharacterized protein n=1 Tax=Clathrus columnatus TaxID=1419009 RepID=A0AAV5A302_9AGAM|nr:hypothetical protein Clacol_003266 [Clathrus columnatus]
MWADVTLQKLVDAHSSVALFNYNYTTELSHDMSERIEMSSLRLQIRQETLGPVSDIYITPVASYPATDFYNEKAEIEVLPPPSLPEGGTQGWMNVVGGWIGSVQLFLMFALSFPVGKLLDDGYFRTLLFLGGILAVISQFAFCLVQAHKYYQVFLAQGVCGGLAAGLLFLPVTSVVTQYFYVKRSLAFGTVLLGSFLGGIVQPIAVNKLFSFRRGSNEFLMAAICLGVIYVVLLGLANLLLKPRIQQPLPKEPALPQTTFIKDFFTDDFYLQLFSAVKGIDSAVVDSVLVILNASAALGCFLFSIPAAYYGCLRVLVPCSFILGILTLGMLLLRDNANVIIFAILYGFFSGGYISQINQMPLAFSQDDRGPGIRSGFWMLTVSGAVLVGAPVLGALLESPQFLWERPVVTSAVLMFIGSFLLLASGVLLAKKRSP